MGDFEYLVGQVFRDDENQLLYVTTRIAKGPKNFIVAYVAEISLGVLCIRRSRDPCMYLRWLKWYWNTKRLLNSGVYGGDHVTIVPLEFRNDTISRKRLRSTVTHIPVNFQFFASKLRLNQVLQVV